ncbi:MAG: 1-phosphofructokinase [Faecalibacterium sp.]|nr:1-phosphofructokinase [Faecalibacterium sp.]
MIYTVTLNPAIDYVMQLGDTLQPGAVNRAGHTAYQFGGKGINVSTVLARLGVPSVALGFAAGATGEWLAQGLAQQGLNADLIRLPEGMTRINVKLRAGPQGEETELNAMGPLISADAFARLQAKLEALQPQDILVLSGSIPMGVPRDIYLRLAQPLATRGVRVVVDTAGSALWQTLPCKPYLVKPNHHELGELFGRDLRTEAEIVERAGILQRQGARNVLVSMAGNGALLLDETGAVHRVGAPRGTVINSVGAGDSMVAGFLAGIACGKDYADALRLGIACGSATAFSLGLAEAQQIEQILTTDF